jgi:hypothetical protein
MSKTQIGCSSKQVDAVIKRAAAGNAEFFVCTTPT